LDFNLWHSGLAPRESYGLDASSIFYWSLNTDSKHARCGSNLHAEPGRMSELGQGTNPLTREGLAAQSSDYVCRSNYLNERK
ncbi:MAG TPA: hypothetical protein VJ349_02590, partial [Stellaceae bacterium]|nr:hypothetical protein [Stellaceae bacterium]